MSKKCPSCQFESGHSQSCPKYKERKASELFEGKDSSLRQTYEKAIKEPHETKHGWCCACDYDLIELDRRIQDERQRIIDIISTYNLHYGDKVALIDEIKEPPAYIGGVDFKK